MLGMPMGFAENDEMVAAENYINIGDILTSLDFAFVGWNSDYLNVQTGTQVIQMAPNHLSKEIPTDSQESVTKCHGIHPLNSAIYCFLF